MKFSDAPQRAVGIIAFVIVVVAISVVGGLVAGQMVAAHGHRAEWMALFELPVGELYALTDPPVVIQKTGPRALVFRPLPSRKDVHVVQLFGNPPPTESSIVTTTTIATTTTTRPRHAIKKPEPKKVEEKKP